MLHIGLVSPCMIHVYYYKDGRRELLLTVDFNNKTIYDIAFMKSQSLFKSEYVPGCSTFLKNLRCMLLLPWNQQNQKGSPHGKDTRKHSSVKGKHFCWNSNVTQVSNLNCTTRGFLFLGKKDVLACAQAHPVNLYRTNRAGRLEGDVCESYSWNWAFCCEIPNVPIRSSNRLQKSYGFEFVFCYFQSAKLDM